MPFVLILISVHTPRMSNIISIVSFNRPISVKGSPPVMEMPLTAFSLFISLRTVSRYLRFKNSFMPLPHAAEQNLQEAPQ